MVDRDPHSTMQPQSKHTIVLAVHQEDGLENIQTDNIQARLTSTDPARPP